MSLHQTVETRCPACDAPGSYEAWSTLNRELDPEAASALARGTLMQFRCVKCDVISTVSHALLLHAMRQKEMVQFGVDEQPASPPEIDELIVSQGIRLWTAPTRNHLMECARLYEAGLDLFAMNVFVERLRSAVESAEGVIVEAVHFDGVVVVEGASRVAFVVFAESVEAPMQVSVPLEDVRANEVQLAPLRERCVPAGVWTPWDRKIARAGIAMLAARALQPSTK